MVISMVYVAILGHGVVGSGVAEVLRKNAGFWMLVVGFVMMGVVNGAVITNSIANMTSVTLDGVEVVTGGHSTMWAGSVWSFYLALVIVMKVLLGAIASG